MWARIRETLADWYILIVAICLIAGGMFAASHQAAAPTTTLQSTTQTPTAPSPTSVAMSQQPQRAPSATPPAPSQPSARQTPTSPAGSPAAPLGSRQAGSSAGVARSWHANSGCERAVACAHERPGRDSRRRYPWRRRRRSRPPCLPKMPSMPFNGCRQEHAGSFARGHHGP